MTEQPTTAAGRLRDRLTGSSWGWPNIQASLLDLDAIEAEARQQDGSVLRLLRELNDVRITSTDADRAVLVDLREKARRALAALPPSAPPALDVDVLASWLCEKFHRGPKMTWPLERCGIREQHLSDAAEYARLQEQDR